MNYKALILIVMFSGSLWSFDRAVPGFEFGFPEDHFEHPTYEIEWWYYTGNVKTDSGRHFGYELTFFRLATERSAPATSPWDVDQLYVAHFALSDIESGRFIRSERLNRGGPGLAGASFEKLQIWNGNWSSLWGAEGGQSLFAVSDDAGIRLELRPAKPPVVHGVNGVSQKSEGLGRASHYITFTRLDTTGEIEIGGETYSVEGVSWMDHEFSTDSMGPSQQGWDWMSIQFDDNTELMLYGPRLEDGTVDAYSSGTFVNASGSSMHLSADEFSLKPGRTWQSPETGARYPVEWTIEVPGLGIELACSPLLDSQEVQGSESVTPTYWEGAVRYSGTRNGSPLEGVGYLEMTGYDSKIRLGR